MPYQSAINDALGSKDISDIAPVNNSVVSPVYLPIRGEKRIVPTPVSPVDISTSFWKVDPKHSPIVSQQDFYLKAAMKPFIDYVYIRLPYRGGPANTVPDANTPPAVYRFLINPSQVSINRTMLDGQAMTRAGWQIGVWGEDSVQIRLNGKTAGQYWSFGITDRYQEFTQSYRNVLMLQQVFENNGYWFEGEISGEGPLAADWTRRRIKQHSDVELTVGNFIWSGMFESLTLTQSADQPWLISFALSFIAWKEKFRSSSPYQNPILNNVQRGHSFQPMATTTQPATTGLVQGPASPTGSITTSDVSAANAQIPPLLTSLVSPVEVSAATSPWLDSLTNPSNISYSPTPTTNNPQGFRQSGLAIPVTEGV